MKQLTKTKVTVRLRKAENRKEWYVYLESYPVLIPGRPIRDREPLNRIVTTVEWDKKRSARTDIKNGKQTYKPKRDDNGIIICKGEIDIETMLYADGIRKLRQREFDNADLYNDIESKEVAKREKEATNFIKYFRDLQKARHSNSSKSINTTWNSTLAFLLEFAGNDLIFRDVNVSFAERFQSFLLTAKCRGSKSGIISVNTAGTYFSVFKAVLAQAFIDDFYQSDISDKIKGIGVVEPHREHLSIEELNKLAITPCHDEELKRAALFSALTGLRHCDIKKLRWKELDIQSNRIKIQFRQSKTKGAEYTPISKQAMELCGTPRLPEQLVFEDLIDTSWITRPLKKWITDAGIQKHITFHCFRHTFATLQLSSGTDLYTVSKMLGHKKVTTTQIYAKVVDELKDRAANAIQLKSVDLEP